MKQKTHFRYHALSVCILCAMQSMTAYADDSDDADALPTVQLPTMQVIGVNPNNTPQKQSTSQISKSAKELSEQMVSDSRDLVRHETGVSVVETGRFGAGGYSVRGVDENRVAISIDGLRQAETLSSQGFKELFEGYGNFNNTRNGVEIENLQSAVIKKGADSVASGNGALGGAVVFKTKDARDYLLDKDWHIGYKTGYASADEQKVNSLTLAGRLGKFDALVVATRRDGHELKNYGYDQYDERVQGRERKKADPYDIKQDSTLAKISFSPNDNHRFTIISDHTERTNQGHDFSYTLKYSAYYNPLEEDLRHTNDKSKRRNFGIAYENTASNALWDSAKISFSNQKITTKARTDDYCDGNEQCNSVANPLGLHIVNNQLVDKDDKAATFNKTDAYTHTLVIDGKEHTDHYTPKRLREIWFDCSVFDCNGSITANKDEYDAENFEHHYNNAKFDFKDANIVTDSQGKRFANFDKASYQDSYAIPNTLGYLTNYYSDRDLNTDTKQLDLDLKKYLTTGKVTHQLGYGISYSETEKSMVNTAGVSGRDPQWWTKQYLGLNRSTGKPYASCQEAKDDFEYPSPVVCPTEDKFSFLIPVKTKDSSLYFSNHLTLGDKVSVDVGYRYNQIKYQPKYVAGQTAKIPDDMVKGLFIALPKATHGDEPKWWNYAGYSDPKYLADKAAWEEADKAYKQAVANNPAENIAFLSQNRKHNQHSYSLATTFDAFSHLRLQAKYAQGFRMPTVDEMYFTFQHPDITVLPNVGLKPELAKTKELALTLHGQAGFITGSVFRTDYDDFIDFQYLGNKDLKNLYGGTASSRNYPLYQSINRQKAKVDGFEINSRLDIGALSPALAGLNVSYKYTHQKGLADGSIPMNAIQPDASVFGIGYDSKNKRFGGNLYLSHIAAKKDKDTYNIFWKEENADNSHAKWRSNSHALVDLTAYVKPTKNLTLQAGVYNLTNEKYLTWESARSIRSFGTSNLIGRDGTGIERFYAPERNFKFSAELVF
ncbi:TonB-dependent hemoglobin/transferrin/lactoferrin family receptor [Moraxella marmotae]|uniref:TonB-dependent hemoglobin/transferrin/lactoferrin family receptor n=1 Tax=Moraxella marmotae TaxID=3344520 RepID=UPI0035F24CE6